MRSNPPQDRATRIRLNHGLLTAARAKAARDGTTVSAMIRAALQRETGAAA